MSNFFEQIIYIHCCATQIPTSSLAHELAIGALFLKTNKKSIIPFPNYFMSILADGNNRLKLLRILRRLVKNLDFNV
uniref:Uncharacterized protein n=1 Tax=Onchocerca volvulus TaxID=6282 RepID=A0A8R1TZX5_ONCVO